MRLTTRIATVGTAILLLTPNLSRATDILFLTGSPTPTAADQAILNQLTSLGYTVTQKDGHASSPLDMIGEHLLVTSATLGSSVIKNQWNSTGPVVTAGDGAQYRNLPYPILNFQNGISDEMGMTNSTNGGQGAGTNSGSAYPGQGTDIKIVDAASPLAAGLPAGFQSIFMPTRRASKFSGIRTSGRLETRWRRAWTSWRPSRHCRPAVQRSIQRSRASSRLSSGER